MKEYRKEKKEEKKVCHKPVLTCRGNLKDAVATPETASYVSCFLEIS
mgnify:CR=1 FL=1